MQRTEIIRPHHDDDDAIVHRLEQIRQIIEDKFVAAGEILLKSIEGIDDLVKSLDRFSKTFDKRTAAATKADLTVAAAKLCTLPACHARQVDHIGQLSRSRAKLGRHVSAIRCHLAFLAAFSRNAKFVADSVPGAGFVHLAEAIAPRVTEGAGELMTLQSELSDLQRNLEAAATKGEILGRQIAALLPAVPEDLVAAARIVSQHYTDVAATAEQVSAIARDIQGRVVRFLAALQFGDITRQRIEHILSCLIRVKADATFVPLQIRHRFKATCHALIAMQLAAITADFDRESAEIEQNMRTLAADAKALLRLHNLAFDCDGGKRSGFLHVLAAQIDTASQLVATVEAADRSAIETGWATVETAHKLEQRIDRIQALRNEMRAIALGYSDSGAPLSDVADEIRENNRLLEEAARVGLASLDKLLHLANRVIGTGGDPRPEDSRAAAAAAALTVAAMRIREARDNTETNIAAVATQGDAVVHMLTLSGARLSLRRDIGDILSFASSDAARLADGAYGPTEEVPDELVRTLAGFSETYTMAPERWLHQAFLTTLAIDDTRPDMSIEEPGAVLF